MCALGLYLAFLLFEDMIVGNYSSNTTLGQNLALKAAYNTFRKDNMLQRKNISKRSIVKQHIRILNISTASEKPRKRSEVIKVTQKQHEIINMLWKRTKIFVDESNMYTINATKMLLHKREYSPLTFSTPSLPLQTTKTSNIEFYYLDDMHSRTKKNCTESNCNSDKNLEKTSSQPFLIFHLKGPYVDPIPQSFTKRFNHSRFQNDQMRISAIRLKDVQKLSQKITNAPILYGKEVKDAVHDKTVRPFGKIYSSNRPFKSKTRKEFFLDSNGVMKRAIQAPPTLYNLYYATASGSHRNAYITESTTVYDKIKFFEINDKFTRTQYTKKFAVKVNHTARNVFDDNEKILLEHIEQGSHDHVQAKHKKKHVTESDFELHFLNGVVSTSNVFTPNDTHKIQPNRTPYYVNENTKSKPNNTDFFYLNETTRWSDYPFAAVYIYEPSQVHCDAAAINSHWLIASGSCLSRVNRNVNAPFGPYGEGQSAFVAYCGDKWWEPERVAYVKYTIVHPWYHPRDKTRQHLYNIGAIQVVNSLVSACASWAPVTLMSHQFDATAEITWATAVGWGLDRFDTRYGATDLPKTPLMAYKSIVYFDSCPGNAGYSKAKRLDEGGGVRNVHCLSLPPYYGEDADPVHGGLLLADGKLIALYLQEERRPWGAQSAQYTGVWRLVPWLMDTAREPEDIETILFDI